MTLEEEAEETIFHSLLFMNGILWMQAHMTGGGASNFFPPHNHAPGVESQFQIVINVTRDACRWLNDKTDHLTDDEACEYVRGELETCLSEVAVGERRTAFGNIVPIMSSMKIVAVTCYPAAQGGVSSAVDDRVNEVATRRFLVHYNGF